jgi:hypothetical protein
MRVFGWTGSRGGVHHFRIREPLRGLRLRGHEIRISPKLSDEIASKYDIILVRGLHDHNSMLWRYLAQKGKHLLILDIDDDVWNWNPKTTAFKYWTDYRLAELEENIRVASLVTTPSPRFAEVLRELNPNVAVVLNTIPLYVSQLPKEVNGFFTVGWQGGEQHIDDMLHALPAIFRFISLNKRTRLKIYGTHWIAGLEDFPTEIQNRVSFVPWESDVDSYYRTLNMDVGLAPLSNKDIFNETKSGLKVQEYSVRGIVSLASYMPPYYSVLHQGQNGYFVWENEWDSLLSSLYEHSGELARMSQQARFISRPWITENYSANLEALYLRELARVRGKGHA